MIKADTFKFLKQVAAHSNKAWIEAHREQYDAARKNVCDFAELLIDHARDFDHRVVEQHSVPWKAVSRLSRDQRFASGKPPYKSDFFITLRTVPKASAVAAYYVHIENGNCYAGGGSFNPPTKTLVGIRRAIDKDTSSWTKILRRASFTKWFPDGLTSSGALVNVPRGYDRDHEAAHFLKQKGFCTVRQISDAALSSSRGLDEILQILKASKPLVDFLNEANRR